MANKPLLDETALALRTLCSSCGLPKTGAKRILVQRLSRATRQFQPITPESRILSIDLGLKNFAYALLSPVAPPKKGNQPPSWLDINNPLNLPVHLHAWNRLDLTLRSPTQQSPSNNGKNHRPDSGTEAEGDEAEEGGGEGGEGKKGKGGRGEEEGEGEGEEGGEGGGGEGGGDYYSPATLSAVATHLVRTRLLPLRPTHVLIERQRFRTGGGAAIFEWTLRVNSLEAMLHAAFAALRGVRIPSPPRSDKGDDSGSDGDGDGGSGDIVWDGAVCSVLPRAVAGFLFPAGSDALLSAEDGVDAAQGKEKKAVSGASAAYQMLKKEKVNILARHLSDQPLLIPAGEQAGEMVRLFMAGVEKRREGKRKSVKKRSKDEVEQAEQKEVEAEEVVGKLDDLSDAVLQGMVWLQWQSNLEALIRERPALLDNNQGEPMSSS